jgi:type II secretory pathway component PulJ
MTRRKRPQPAFMLAELLGALALTGLIAGLVVKLLLDVLALESAATEHANRMAVMDAAVRQMRRDAVAAADCARDGDALVLTLAGAEGPQRVRWTVAPDVFRRVREDGEDREWRATRLRFAWRIEHGPRGDVFTIDFIETPPPRGSALPNRTYSAAFLLPHATVALAPRTEGTP